MVKFDIVFSVITGSLLMLLSSLAVSSVPLRMTRITQNDNSDKQSLIAFSLMSPIGCIIGSFPYCFLADVIGRKYTHTVLCLPIIFSSLLFQFSKEYSILCFAALLGGLSLGGSYAVLPLYFGEIAENKSRGALTVLLYPCYVLGNMLIMFLLKIFTVDITQSIVSFGSIVISILVGILSITVAIESPVYCFERLKQKTAKEDVYGISNSSVNMELELRVLGKVSDEMRNTDNEERIMTSLKSIGWLKAAIMILVLLVYISLCGIPILHFLHTKYYLDSLDYVLAEFIIGAFHLVTSLLLCPILIDKVGRKMCLMVSFVGTAISVTLFAIFNVLNTNHILHINSYVLISVTLLFYTSFNLGASPVSLALIGELFSLRTKMLASAVMTAILFSLRIIVSLLMTRLIEAWPYVNIVVSCICIIVVAFYYLETSGKSLNEIQIILNRP